MKIGTFSIHAHAISVHFTNALYPVAVLFLLLFKVFQEDSLRSTYFHIMLLASLSAPISFVTGVVEWKQKYKGVRVKIFSNKYIYGIILVAVGSTCTIWNFLSPEIVTSKGSLHIIHLSLNVTILPLAAYLGHLGGKLVFGGGH